MRQRLSLDRNWRFSLTTSELDLEFARDRALVKSGEGRGAANPKSDDSMWQVVDAPHDWAVDLPLVRSDDREVVEHAFRAIGPQHPRNSVGWYRRTFEIPRSDLGRRISVEFDGVFRDSVVWINGHRLGRHASGHTSFRYDLTDMLNYGGPNVLTVRVDATSWEGWWYEGAGIYRHVWLVKTSPIHVAHWGTQVITQVAGTKARRHEGTKKAIVVVRTTVVNDGDRRQVVNLRSRISNSKSQITSRVIVKPWSQAEVEQQLVIPSARLWSPDRPNLYKLVSTIDGHDRFETVFGVRTLRWDARRGFFLNGRPLKIKGTCNHQNHAGVGTAMPDKLHEWRVRRLKEMGCNAYRCSHYPATPELLDICDRLGMLVMAENRLAGSAAEFLEDFQSMMVDRQRRTHHPVVDRRRTDRQNAGAYRA
jgi:beta-galactosidase